MTLRADDAVSTAKQMQATHSGAHALKTAANGLWCRDLPSLPDRLAAHLQLLSSSSIVCINLINDIKHLFGSSQVIFSRLWPNAHAKPVNSCDVDAAAQQ